VCTETPAVAPDYIEQRPRRGQKAAAWVRRNKIRDVSRPCNIRQPAVNQTAAAVAISDARAHTFKRLHGNYCITDKTRMRIIAELPSKKIR